METKEYNKRINEINKSLIKAIMIAVRQKLMPMSHIYKIISQACHFRNIRNPKTLKYKNLKEEYEY
jgi:hypothetical protein